SDILAAWTAMGQSPGHGFGWFALDGGRDGPFVVLHPVADLCTQRPLTIGTICEHGLSRGRSLRDLCPHDHIAAPQALSGRSPGIGRARHGRYQLDFCRCLGRLPSAVLQSCLHHRKSSRPVLGIVLSARSARQLNSATSGTVPASVEHGCASRAGAPTGPTADRPVGEPSLYTPLCDRLADEHGNYGPCVSDGALRWLEQHDRALLGVFQPATPGHPASGGDLLAECAAALRA